MSHKQLQNVLCMQKSFRRGWVFCQLFIICDVIHGQNKYPTPRFELVNNQLHTRCSAKVLEVLSNLISDNNPWLWLALWNTPGGTMGKHKPPPITQHTCCCACKICVQLISLDHNQSYHNNQSRNVFDRWFDYALCSLFNYEFAAIVMSKFLWCNYTCYCA